MNENIDLTKILEGCPVGTEFYHAGWDKVVKFMGIDLSSRHPIQLETYPNSYHNIAIFYVSKKGTYYDSECCLFPSKEQRDWSKFERFWDKPKAEEPMVEMFDENTLKPFDKVLVRNFIFDCWNAVTFSHINFKRQAVCCGISWEQCVPYNEKTKYLVNTNEDCPEYYKWWTV